MKTFAAALALLLSAVFVSAQTGLVYEWRQLKDCDQLALYKNGRQLGNFSIETQQYKPLAGNSWGKACQPPFAVPEWAVRQKDNEEPVFNFGIVREALRSEIAQPAAAGGERITMHGQEISRSGYAAALKGEQKIIPDDSAKLRLIVTGPQADAFVKDWHASETVKDVRDKVALWVVPPDHWSLRDNATGAPMYPCAIAGRGVCLTTGIGDDGRAEAVLYSEPDYQGPGDFQAIRRAIDVHEGKTYPGRTQPVLSASSTPSLVGGAAALALLGGAYARRRFRQ